LKARLRITFEPIENVVGSYQGTSQAVNIEIMADSEGNPATGAALESVGSIQSEPLSDDVDSSAKAWVM
jgi:hypothetical protein